MDKFLMPVMKDGLKKKNKNPLKSPLSQKGTSSHILETRFVLKL